MSLICPPLCVLHEFVYVYITACTCDDIRMPYMPALYVCLICLPYMPAVYACLIRLPYMSALYACLICLPYMCDTELEAFKKSAGDLCRAVRASAKDPQVE
jgi:hypothetical protein